MLCGLCQPIVLKADLLLASFIIPLEFELRSLSYVTMDPTFASLSELSSDDSAAMKNPPKLEVDATDGPFANKHGRHVIGHVDDYDALQQQIGEGKLLVQKILSLMRSARSIPVREAQGTEVRLVTLLVTLVLWLHLLCEVLTSRLPISQQPGSGLCLSHPGPSLSPVFTLLQNRLT